VTRARRDGAIVFVTALAARLAVVAWAAGRFPAAADGTYYDIIARRVAAGHGYTWVWPDGAVTYAAHYPIGYPALIAMGYAVFGAAPWVAMLVNAIAGAGCAAAACALARRSGDDRAALASGLLVALHPALVPYTAAIMTEGVTASLLAIAAACAERRAVAGLVMGAATLIRPQSLVLAPLLGALSGRGWRARALGAATVGAIAVAACLPWTVRNAVRMHRPALVSVNAGWNLLIGEETTTGAWSPVDVPAECREVWDEAGKDACFERAARARIAAHPVAWIAKAPAKVGVTFDYFGAAPWYLHDANAGAFDERAKVALGAVETIASRILLVIALAAAARRSPWPRAARAVLFAAGAAFALTRHGWIGYLALAIALIPSARGRAPLEPWTACVIAATALTHAVFFGAGRYGLVAAPLVAAVAGLAFSRASIGSPPRPA